MNNEYNYLHESIEENAEESSNRDIDRIQDNNELNFDKKEIIYDNDINRTPIKNREERNKMFMETMIDVLEEASGKIRKSSSGKKNKKDKNI